MMKFKELNWVILGLLSVICLCCGLFFTTFFIYIKTEDKCIYAGPFSLLAYDECMISLHKIINTNPTRTITDNAKEYSLNIPYEWQNNYVEEYLEIKINSESLDSILVKKEESINSVPESISVEGCEKQLEVIQDYSESINDDSFTGKVSFLNELKYPACKFEYKIFDPSNNEKYQSLKYNQIVYAIKNPYNNRYYTITVFLYPGSQNQDSFDQVARSLKFND